MKDVQCYELFGGIALKNHAFSFFIFFHLIILLLIVSDSFFHQHVTIPTHSRYNQDPSILDLILTNEEGMASSFSHMCPLGKSDHSILTFNFHCYIQHRRHYRI